MKGFFVTGTGTNEGKTFVTRGLARHLRRRGVDVAALKPLETGVDPTPVDAQALAHACGRPELADLPGFYRACAPLSPFSATMRGEPPVPPTSSLITSLDQVVCDIMLVEGAGGVLVPLDAKRTIADLIAALRIPSLLVARNGLGVISHVCCAHEALAHRQLSIAAVVLTEHGPADTSQDDNLQALRALLPTPVVRFPSAPNDDDALAIAATELASLLVRNMYLQ
ncbi:MAG: dethiobiotin synthase [Polyangiales bacterium]|nr:dethiobiotin synthase [Sandaracinaceae bacterium]